MKNAIIPLITLLSLWFALFYFLMTITSIADAKTIPTSVTVPVEVGIYTRVNTNPCNECIRLCEGRQRCKDTCFNLICNKK